MQANITQLSVGIEYIATEKEDFRNALYLLYNGVALELPDVPERLRRVRLLLHSIGETGTTPSVWANPKLKQVAEASWKAIHANFEKNLGEDAIIRNLGCKQCGLIIQAALPLKMDAVSCPRCNSVLKW